MSATERRLHERVLALAAVALDFGLAPPEHALLADHLAGCPACARGVAGLRGDAAALRRPAELATSARLDAAVAAAIAGQPARRPAASRTLVLVAATALLLVALLGLAAAGAFLLHDRLPAVVVPTPSAPAVVVPVSPGPDASAEPAPSPAPAWQVGAIPPMFEGGMAVPVAIAAGPTTFALVGAREFEDMQAPSGGTAGAWRSTDGLAWDQATKNTALSIGNAIYVDGPNPGMIDVAWGPPGFVAIGWVEDGDAIVAGAWRSPDARTWERSDFPGTAAAHLAAVTWSGSAYVVVGTMYEEDSPRAAVWLSADGVSWRRMPDAAAFDIGGYHTLPGGQGACGPVDVTANSGRCAARRGARLRGDRRQRHRWAAWPFAVGSTDGETWTSVPVPALTRPGAGSPAFSAAAASGARFVAVAGPGDQPAVLIGDGADWRVVEPAGVPSFSRVIAYREGFLALSTEGEAISLWSSADGEGWTAVQGVPQPSDVTALHDVDLATNGTRVVIAGYAEVDSAAGYSAFSLVGSPEAPAAVPTASPEPGAWAPVPSQEAVSGVQLQDVVWTGSRFVAVGGALDGDHVFLNSPDGLTWHRQASGGGTDAPGRLATGPGGLVAVGTIDDRPASWTSSDGLAWTEHADAFPVPALGTDDIEVTDVIATDDGWLAVGRRDPACRLNCGLDPIRAYVWTSSDGARWTKLDDQAPLEGGGIEAVARTDGEFVAAGVVSGRAAIWTSPDGSTWTRVPDDPMFGDVAALGTQATGVAARDGVVAVLGISAGEAARGVRAWWSTAGTTWSEGSVETPANGQVFSVTATPSGFLAAGPSGDSSCLGGIWDSTDGRAWRCVATDPAFAGFGPYAVAASDTLEVAVGLGVAGWDENAGRGMPGAVWVRRLP